MEGTNPLKELEGYKVLVVEDQPLEAIDYCDLLTDAGAEIVGPFTSVSEALTCVDNALIDVALLDYALADQNSERLQNALERRSIPFVVLSGYPPVLVRRNEGQRVLSKPISPDLLRIALRSACRGEPPQSITH